MLLNIYLSNNISDVMRGDRFCEELAMIQKGMCFL